MLNTFEMALRERVYWDWSQDIDSGIPLVQSPVFDSVYGFGGNAPGGGGGCVTDGPFAGYTLNLGPGTNVTKHCLQRAFNDHVRSFLSGARVNNVLAQTTFEAFRIELEGAPVTPTMRLHDAGHNAVGGEMADRYSSPGDPIFYSHHAFLDKLWWDWVGLDFSSRIVDMSGRSTVAPPYTNVTLEFELDMLGIAPQ
ncbi:hypothetical protein C8F01DRAFT_1164078, partial [Mycena amicta]